MSRTFRMVCLVLSLLAGSAARAELQIDITRGVTDPVPVAVVPFARAAAVDGSVDVAAIVERDLAGSGRFKDWPARPCPRSRSALPM